VKTKESIIFNGPLTTAVLFLVFNRPEVTKTVFQAIRTAQPQKLYVAADGPRVERKGEATQCEITRRIATAVDWPCQVKTLFRPTNLGCKKAVSEGISWFFKHEERGIILEDDCLPAQSFFFFCEELLDRYATERRVWAITGDNFQDGIKRGDASYYFSRYNHVWGWASWRRAWEVADMDINFWPKWKTSKAWRDFWPSYLVRRYWEKIFDQMYRKEIDTWDYPWTASTWLHGGLTVTPNVNLVSNIGFGKDSTHTSFANSPLANLPRTEITKISHPNSIDWNKEADEYVFNYAFNGRDKRFPRICYIYFNRVLRKIFNTIVCRITRQFRVL
jgi:hypothetical protein